MQHRRFLTHPEVHRPFAGSELFAQGGGRAAIEALVDGLYDRIETDPLLRALFKRDVTNEREAQKRFFTEWVGGASAYSENAYLSLCQRHDLLPITPALAGRWLGHFKSALDSAVADEHARRTLYDAVRVFAKALVNEGARPSSLREHPHGVCLRYAPAVESIGVARRGDAAALRALLAAAPDVLASASHAALLLHVAALAGRMSVVELLLDNGVDPNKPSPIESLIFVTPLCAARVRKQKKVEALLLKKGAKEDLFTHAFLGDLPSLRAALTLEPRSAQIVDPATDALEITPLHHALAGGSVEALRTLLACVVRSKAPLLGAARAIRQAATRENVAAVALLLEHGADATHIGAGRWVLHPELAPLLSRAGAHVDRSGAWIGLSCTGNQGRKDDPDYVAALLRYGARANDKRETGQGADGGRAGALHYAAKAGFSRTISVLLEHGADRDARDDNGQTPLDWLARAVKSVDREAVRRLLSPQSQQEPVLRREGR